MDEAVPCARRPASGGCVGFGTQYADVALPVKLSPIAKTGKIITECCGEPSVTLNPCSCGGCAILIRQTIRMTIPVEYGACAESGEPAVNCRKAPPACR